MLKEDVVEAIRNEQFHVFAVSTVDEALEILTGEQAGKRDEQGKFPDGTVNCAVEAQLTEYARNRRNFGLKAEQAHDEP
jgi:predicted ATP-dependent protease